MSKIRRFKTNWTPKKIKEFRSEFQLSQDLLAALLLKIPQQRISEWENGKQSMGRGYTVLFNSLEGKLKDMRAKIKCDKKLKEAIERLAA